MIELVFVIVILGILAGVAIPKLAATRDDAHIAAGRADILAVRSGIITKRQAGMFRGNSAYTASLGGSTVLFGEVLQSPVRSSTKSGGWTKSSETLYKFHLGPVVLDFDYNTTNGTFNCSTEDGSASQDQLCRNLTR
jgi:general secretion pathway protein G